MLLLLLACGGPPRPSQPSVTHPTLSITATPIAAPSVSGDLQPEGSWVLTRSDSGWDPSGMKGRCRRSLADFGGYSGLAWDRGAFLAASDRGHLLWFTLTDNTILNARMAILGDCGAEAVRSDGDDLWIVYEESARVERYHPERGTMELDVGWQAGLTYLASNEGMEALAVLPDGRRLLLASGPVSEAPAGNTAGRLLSADGQLLATLSYPLRVADGVPYTPTELAVTSDGRLLLLERSWHNRQNRARISELPLSQLTDGAVLSPVLLGSLGPEQPIDNMEGMAIEPHPDGDRLWLISDDNPQASTGQRVLLFSFRLEASP